MEPPTSETVGNGLCAVPGTRRIQPVWMNGTTCRYVIPSERSESRNLPEGISPGDENEYITDIFFHIL